MIWFSVYIGIVIACLVTYWLNRQSLPAYFKYFQYLFTAILFVEVGEIVLNHYRINSNFLDHLYQPVEFTLISLIYRQAIRTPKFDNLVKYLLFFFWIVSVFASVVIEGIFSRNTISFILGSTLVIFYSIYYIFQLYTQPPTRESLLANPFFWINTAHLFFYGGTFLQMGMDSYLMKRDILLAQQLHVINYALNYTLYLLYLLGFVCRRIFK
jgi:hypothetical protein